MVQWLPLANAGTPLVWFGALYPILGSLGVARLEEWLLRRWYPMIRPEPRWRPLIVGNNLTTGVGIWMVNAANVHRDMLFGPRPVEAVLQVSALMWIVAFVSSVLIEAPLVWARMGSLAGLKRVALATLGLHAISYALIFGLYLAFSGSSLGFTAQVAKIGSISEPDGWVYYVARDRQTVRRVRLDGSRYEATQHRMAAGHETLSIESVDGKVARLVSEEYYGEPVNVLDPRLGVARQAGFHWPQRHDLTRLDRSGYGYMPAPNLAGWDLSDDQRPPFGAANRVWPEFGMGVYDRERKTGFWLGLSTPFAHWIWRKPTVTADGRVVAKWGPQIVVVDIPTRRVAWLANGTSPTVLMDRPASRPER